MNRHLIQSTRYTPGVFVQGEYQPDLAVAAYDQRLIIAGAENGLPGYTFGEIPPGAQGRQFTNGRLVDGPWAFLVGRAAVLDGRTGLTDQRDGGILVAPGDEIQIRGTTRVYRVDLDQRGYPEPVLISR